MKELDIKVGYACNNSCIFCLNKEKRYYKEFPVEDLKRQIVDSANVGCKKLIISGGEPLISKHLFDLLAFAKQKGIKAIEIQTNGRMLSYETLVKKLKEFQFISFLVSLHFSNPGLYRTYCRSDGFYQVVKGIKNLVRNKQDLTINTVVMKMNLPYLKELVKLLKGIGVVKIQYRFIDGRNVMDRYKEFVPQYKEAVPTIREIIKENPSLNIRINEIPLCVLGEEFKDSLAPPANPERVNLSIGNKLFTSPEILKSQFIFPNCEECFYHPTCKGIRKEYCQIYDTSEIKPIIKQPY
ncbi:MAG: radical SAM protein [Candidatus Nealsonbacteria bacterium]|nr:MAG: radical SAM protein [Candidatus Nealsonbacteria bacterium]